jgi:DNA polymerase III alpha subunit
LYAGFFDRSGTTPFSRLKILPDRASILVEGVVKAVLREFRIKTGRYKGKPMIKYQIEDIYGTETELTVWPSEYAKAKKYLLPGKPFKAECQVSEFNTVKTIMLRDFVKVQA